MERLFPDHIINEIYWYRWLDNIKKLNIDYNESTISDNSYYYDPDHTGGLVYMLYVPDNNIDKITAFFAFNYRDINKLSNYHNYYNSIHRIDRKKGLFFEVAKIPKKY